MTHYDSLIKALELEGGSSESKKYDETMMIIFAGFYGFYCVGKLLDIGMYTRLD